MDGIEPRSVGIRPARFGYWWRLHLWEHGHGSLYRSGWRPTSVGAQRRGRAAFERAQRRFDRRNAWRRA